MYYKIITVLSVFFHNLLSWQVRLDHLTSLYLDPLGLHRGHIKPLFGVDLPDVIAGSQGPQRVPGALIPSGWSNCSLVFRDGGSEPEHIQTFNAFYSRSPIL